MHVPVLLLFVFGKALASHSPTVRAPSGIFLGNSSVHQLDQFLGIRYAEPPVDSLRFANPVKYPPSPRKAIKARAYGPGCIQLDSYREYNGLSEDCLTLNVVRPSGTCSTASLPVMVWIHGGGNINGQSIFYNGTALVQHSITMQQPIIYVSANYRLGGFGFMRSPEFLAAGILNLGLKDQQLVLKWVHENIESFGGDPRKVTIFGESAGAANCWSHLHYAYTHNEVNKFFRGMITESGAPGSPSFPLALEASDQSALPISYAELLARTGCESEGLSCLRKAPRHVISPLLIDAPGINYGIDNDWFDTNLTSLLESGQFAPLPIIHGTNLDEGTFFVSFPPTWNSQQVLKLTSHLLTSSQLPSVFDFPRSTALIETIAGYIGNNISYATRLWQAYNNLPDTALGKGANADPTAPHDFWVALAIYTDLWMDLGRKTFLSIASKKADTWGYEFRQRPPLNAINLSYEVPGTSIAATERFGVYHGSELPYVFGEITHLEGHTDGDDKVAIAMMNAWINFAYFLNPNRQQNTLTPFWPTYNSSGRSELMVFEDQKGQSFRITQDATRREVYRMWASALTANGEHPPY